MSFTSNYLDKIPPIVPRSDTENFHDQTFYEQCLGVLMGVGVGALLFTIAELRWLVFSLGATIKYPLQRHRRACVCLHDSYVRTVGYPYNPLGNSALKILLCHYETSIDS